MSYARWAKDHSDVYIYASCGGGIDCCGCFIYKHDFGYKANTSGEMIAHLDEHRSKGHLVPDYTYQQILEDYPNLTAQITDKDG